MLLESERKHWSYVLEQERSNGFPYTWEGMEPEGENREPGLPGGMYMY